MISLGVQHAIELYFHRLHMIKPGTQVKAQGVPHIAYCNQGQSFLGSVDISGQLLGEKRDNLNKHIEDLGPDFKPVILSLKDFEHAARSAHLCIGE